METVTSSPQNTSIIEPPRNEPPKKKEKKKNPQSQASGRHDKPQKKTFTFTANPNPSTNHQLPDAVCWLGQRQLSASRAPFSLINKCNDQIFFAYIDHIGLGEKLAAHERKSLKQHIITVHKYYKDGSSLASKDNFDFLTLILKLDRYATPIGDEPLFAEFPGLAVCFPRSFSLVFNSNHTLIDEVLGAIKFSGCSTFDEDHAIDNDNNDDLGASYKYNHKKTIEWVKCGLCKITSSEKANGKQAVLKLLPCGDRFLVTVGSKNNCISVFSEELEQQAQSQHHPETLRLIISDVHQNWDKLVQLKDEFKNGYTLLGELEDGQHFTTGNNEITWFGLFRGGYAKNEEATFALFNQCGIKAVDSRICFQRGDSWGALVSAFQQPRYSSTEGAVLYIRNTKTSETQTVKIKSVGYILKRMFREYFSHHQHSLEGFVHRVGNNQQRLGCNTEFMITSVNKLHNFAKWMLSNNLPLSLLQHMPPKIKGTIQQRAHGFHHYWQQFLQKTDTVDIVATPADTQGTFDPARFFRETAFHLHPRSPCEPVTIVFLQGIQGSGKSTVAIEMAKQHELQGTSCAVIDQDAFLGCSISTQRALTSYTLDGDGPEVILIARCNAVEEQYRKLLGIALRSFSNVYFLALNERQNLYHLYSALAGITARSHDVKKLNFASDHLPPKEALSMVLSLYSRFVPHPKALLAEILKTPTDAHLPPTGDTKKKINKAIKDLHEDKALRVDECIRIWKGIQKNQQKILDTKLPCETIAEACLQKIAKASPADRITCALENLNFVGLYLVSPSTLTELVYQKIPNPQGRINCTHSTQRYVTKEESRAGSIDESELITHGSQGTLTVSQLYVCQRTGAAAFKVDRIDFTGENDFSLPKNPHVTAVIPKNYSAKQCGELVSKTDGVDIFTFTPITLDAEAAHIPYS